MCSTCSLTPPCRQQDKTLDSYRKAQSEDATCRQVLEYCHTGWPHLKDLDPSFQLYWESHSKLTLCDGLLMLGPRMVITVALQKKSCTSFMKVTKASHVAALEHRFLYGGLVSHNSSKILFNDVQNAPETTNLIRSHSYHPLFQTTMATSSCRTIST